MAKYCVMCYYYDEKNNQRLGRCEIKIPGKITSEKIRESEKILEEKYNAKELIIFNLIKLRRTISEQQE